MSSVILFHGNPYMPPLFEALYSPFFVSSFQYIFILWRTIYWMLPMCESRQILQAIHLKSLLSTCFKLCLCQWKAIEFLKWNCLVEPVNRPSESPILWKWLKYRNRTLHTKLIRRASLLPFMKTWSQENLFHETDFDKEILTSSHLFPCEQW